MPKLRWVAIVCTCFLFLAIMATSYYYEFLKISRFSSKLDSQMSRLVLLSRTMQEYQEKIDYYSTPEGVARLAREEFNFAYPDEKIYKIILVSSDHLSENNQ